MTDENELDKQEQLFRKHFMKVAPSAAAASKDLIRAVADKEITRPLISETVRFVFFMTVFSFPCV